MSLPTKLAITGLWGERRRPIMTAWANFVCNSNADNLVPLRPAQLSPDEQSVIDVVERSKGRPLTKEERHLSLAQARAIGEI